MRQFVGSTGHVRAKGPFAGRSKKKKVEIWKRPAEGLQLGKPFQNGYCGCPEVVVVVILDGLHHHIQPSTTHAFNDDIERPETVLCVCTR